MDRLNSVFPAASLTFSLLMSILVLFEKQNFNTPPPPAFNTPPQPVKKHVDVAAAKAQLHHGHLVQV